MGLVADGTRLEFHEDRRAGRKVLGDIVFGRIDLRDLEAKRGGSGREEVCGGAGSACRIAAIDCKLCHIGRGLVVLACEPHVCHCQARRARAGKAKWKRTIVHEGPVRIPVIELRIGALHDRAGIGARLLRGGRQLLDEVDGRGFAQRKLDDAVIGVGGRVCRDILQLVCIVEGARKLLRNLVVCPVGDAGVDGIRLGCLLLLLLGIACRDAARDAGADAEDRKERDAGNDNQERKRARAPLSPHAQTPDLLARSPAIVRVMQRIAGIMAADSVEASALYALGAAAA